MKRNLNRQSPTEVVLSITLDESYLSGVLVEVFNVFRPNVKAAGFRAGKAPDKVIEKEIGAGAIQQELIEQAVEKAYREAMLEEKLRPLEQPHIELKKFVPYSELEFSAAVEVMPEVKLPNYKKIKKTIPKPEITKEQVETVIEGLRTRVAERVIIKRPAAIGDELLVDYEGTIAGKSFAGGSAKNQTILIGSGRFLPDFEKALLGLKVDDQKSFELTFPKDYYPDVAGKKVTFNVTIKNVTELKKPALDDAFASSVGPFQNLKQLGEDIKKQLQVEQDAANKQAIESEVVAEVVKKAKLHLPDRLVSRELDSILDAREQELKQTGAPVNRAELEKELKPVAIERVRSALVLTEIAEAEQLEVSAEELEMQLQLLAGRYQDKQAQQQLATPEFRRQLADRLLTEKTVARLLEYATS